MHLPQPWFIDKCLWFFMADRFVILNRCLCELIRQDLVLNYVRPLGHLWQILVKVTIDPNSCTRLLFPNWTFSSCYVFVLFTIEARGSWCAWLKKDQRVFSVVVAIIWCGALMPRAIILFSQTKPAISSYIASAFSVSVWHWHHQLSCSNFAWPRSPESYSMPLLSHFSSSYILMFSSSIKLWKNCFSS